MEQHIPRFIKRRSLLFYLLADIVIFIVYSLTASIGLGFDAVSGFATLVWPPTGIALVSVLILGYHVWPAIALGAYFVNASAGAPAPVAAVIALGNTLEALTGAFLLHNVVRIGYSLDRLKDVIGLVIFAALGSTLISATIGTTGLLAGRIITFSSYAPTWIAWWVGNMFGNLVIAPFLLVWSQQLTLPTTYRRVAEAVLALGVLTGISFLVFREFFGIVPQAYPVTYMVFPPMIWIAYRFHQRVVVTATLILAVVAVWITVIGYGPFAMQDLSQSLLFLQIFVAVVTVTSLLFSAIGSERRQASEKLRESEERYRTLVKTLPDPVVLTDLDTNIIMANEQALKLFGDKKMESFLGRNAFDFIVPEDRSRARRSLAKALTKGSIKDVEYTIIDRRKRRKPVDVSASVIRRKTGEPHAILAVVRDVTQRKKIEHQKDDFLALASHELKTPVTSAKLFTEFLHDHYKQRGERETAQYFARLDMQMNRLMRIIQNLLDVSRIPSAKITYHRERVPLDTLISETVGELQIISPHHLLDITALPRLYVHGDKDRIKQVLTNLITNAIRYSPGSGRISIGVQKDAPFATVWVRDFGIGISKQNQQKIFQRYYQVKTSEKKKHAGLGLGLYIAQEIVRRHKGAMWVESSKGKGSTFYFTLPLFRAKRAR